MDRSLRAIAALFVSAMVTAACGASATPQPAVVKIGLEAPLTGAQASNGVDQKNGAELAVMEANAKGTLVGRTLELVPIDDRADPDAGVEAANKAIGGGLFAVVGPYNSAVGAKNLDIYLKAGVIPVHMTSNSITNGKGYTVQPKDYQIAPIEAKAITGFFKARKVAIIYDPSTYTQGIADQLRTLLRDGGVELVAFESIKPGDGSYLNLLKGIAAKGPDLLYTSTYFPEGGVIAKELSQTNLSGVKCLMGLANQDPGFVGAAGQQAAQACSSSGVPAPDQFAGAASYVTAYKGQYGADPGTWGTFTYDSVNLLLDAVRRAGAWDATKVREALTGTRGFEGVTGKVDIHAQSGNRVDVPVVILEIDANGQYVVDPDWATFAGFAVSR